MLENTAHNTVATRMDLNTDLLLAFAYIADLIGLNKAIFESDTLNDLLHIGFGKCLIQSYLIDLSFLIRRVGQSLCQIAIVGKQQHSQRVLIQSTYGIDALRAGTLHDIHNCLRCMVILNSCNKALRLIHQDIDLLLAYNTAIINAHLIGRLNLRTHLGNNNTIDRNLAVGNQFVSLTTRTKTRLCNIAIQANLANLLRSCKTGIRFGDLSCAICSLGADRALIKRTLFTIALTETLLRTLTEATLTLLTIKRTTFAIVVEIALERTMFATVIMVAIEVTMLTITVESAVLTLAIVIKRTTMTLFSRLLRMERII